MYFQLKPVFPLPAFYQIKPPPSLISLEETRVSPTAAFSSLKDRLPDISKCNQVQPLVSLCECLEPPFATLFQVLLKRGNIVTQLFHLLEYREMSICCVITGGSAPSILNCGKHKQISSGCVFGIS